MPLSHAICCRPCLPQALPDSGGALPAGASAVAVISVGCHGSSAQGAAALRCEAAGNSFVSGAPELGGPPAGGSRGAAAGVLWRLCGDAACLRAVCVEARVLHVSPQ